MSEALPDEVVVFDGVCHFCNAWVGFLLQRDRTARYRFAAMQGATGRSLLAANGLDPDDPASFLYFAGGKAYLNTDAIIRVVGGLGGGWRLVVLARVLPAPVRDPAYRWIARHRYRLFGKRQECALPRPEFAARFLD